MNIEKELGENGKKNRTFLENNPGSARKEIISIIIPVYNGEKYLDHCICSIVEQTYPYFELILVDDGSSDDSMMICKSYEKKDPRIKVYHKENGGVSSARNLGLEKATGEFISFVDVDDLIDINFLQILLEDAYKFDADIVCCAVREIESDYNGRETGRLRTVSNCRLIDDFKEYINDYFKEYVADWFYGRVVWGRIIKRKLAVQEKFSDLKFGEDTEYMLKLFAKAPRTYLDNFRGYHYIRWDQSTTNTIPDLQPERMEDRVWLSKTVVEICNKYGDSSLIQKSYEKYAEAVYSLLSAYIKNGSYHKFANAKVKLSKMIALTRHEYIKKKHSVALGLYCLSPLLYWVIFRPLLLLKERVA